MSDSANEISKLCMSCGMCCDGTLFKKGTLADAPDRAIAIEAGLRVFDDDGQFSFKQPCSAFDGCCTIYHLPHPAVCSKFFCHPLKKYASREQTFAEATGQISSLQQQRDQILDIARQFPELEGLKFREVKDILDECAEDSDKVARYAQLYLMLFMFETVRTKYFKAPRKDERLVE